MCIIKSVITLKWMHLFRVKRRSCTTPQFRRKINHFTFTQAPTVSLCQLRISIVLHQLPVRITTANKILLFLLMKTFDNPFTRRDVDAIILKIRWRRNQLFCADARNGKYSRKVSPLSFCFFLFCFRSRRGKMLNFTNGVPSAIQTRDI